MIYTGELYHKCDFSQHLASTVSRHLQKMGLQPVREIIVADRVIDARVNHARWIADCPHCRSADFVFTPELLFMCANCGNDSSYQCYQVAVPGNRSAIEAVLSERDKIENRNWEPGQTVQELESEGGD